MRHTLLANPGMLKFRSKEVQAWMSQQTFDIDGMRFRIASCPDYLGDENKNNRHALDALKADNNVFRPWSQVSFYLMSVKYLT